MLASCQFDPGSAQHPPFVFVIHTGASAVDLKLTRSGQPHLLIENFPNGIAAMRSVSEGYVSLTAKISGLPDWRVWADEENTPYEMLLRRGHSYAVVTQKEKASMIALGERYGSDPKVCFFNNTPNRVSQILVSEDPRQGLKTYEQDMRPGKLGEFHSFKSGRAGVYWKWDDKKDEPEYEYLPGADGQPQSVDFQVGRFYILSLDHDQVSGRVSARIQDITPKKEPQAAKSPS